MKKYVDLNSDVGESFGVYKLGCDEELIKYISSANIACGFHAGDPLVMNQTVRYAVENNVGIGAHIGYPDLLGFGRRKMDITREELKCYTKYQVGSLMAFVKGYNQNISHIKPHGTLYNTISDNEELATALVESIVELDKGILVFALPGSLLEQIATVKGIRVAREAYADRAYNVEGRLVPRTQKYSVIHDVDEVLKRTVKMVQEQKVTTIDGKEISLRFDTICVHGDNPEALNMVKEIKAEFTKNNIEIKRL